MRYTIKELLQNYRITIPQLQRDYAQGRDTEKDLRRSFVTKIIESLKDDSDGLNLDFIYGYTEKNGEEPHLFIPLDGQQRLTTLWLILWYLAPRENNLIDSETQKYLSNFTYETRSSSKRFCHNLVTQPFNLKKGKPISEQIKDSFWFMAAWENDPSIISMLNMLNTLQEEITEKDYSWNYLINERKITFDYINIKSEEFKLTDELYIKMNSRGKPLTIFENFKAQFSTLLSSKSTDYFDVKLIYNNIEVTYQQYFAFKIDSVWMDLFWSYRKKIDSKIDDCIYRYMNYLAEFLFYKETPKTLSSEIKIDFDFLNTVFKTKKNVDFLFKSLDLLSDIKDVPAFFREIFSDVPVFDNYSKDFFKRAISDIGFDVKDKIILYGVLSYCIENCVKEVDSELKDFIRIIRNLLFTVRQINQTRRIEYVSNLRLTNVSEYSKLIDLLIQFKSHQKLLSVYQVFSENEFDGFGQEYIHNEKVKAKIILTKPFLKRSIHLLEDHNQILGNTANFKLESVNIEEKINSFLNIWSENIHNSLIVRSLLSINNYSMITHSYSALGKIRYFGCQNFWNRILTTSNKNESERISNVLDSFLEKFLKTDGETVTNKLNAIINSFESNIRDWRYYFIKNESICQNPYANLNLYTWQNDDGFDINHLGNSGNYPLHSYHLNPYMIPYVNLNNSNNLKVYWGRFADCSYIKINDKVIIRAEKDGWKIIPEIDFSIDQDLIEKYNLQKINENYFTSASDLKDKIEILKDLIDYFCESFMNQDIKF